jgi:AraC-like DNA-binding protein
MNQLDELNALALRYAIREGQNATAIPYFEVLKSTIPTPLKHGILEPSFCIIIQGHKKVLVGSEVLEYGPGSFLASLIAVPAAGQITNASPKRPYIGLRIKYTNEEIASVLVDAKIELKSKDKVKPGAFMALASPDVLQALTKMFGLLEAHKDISYPSQLLKKELIYHLLVGEAGHLFAQNMLLIPSNLGLGKAINWIKDNLDRPFRIEELAKASHMSVSSLHHKFKAFMAMGPLQYQKQLRLQEARRLLINGEESDATSVALRVGYDSSSQFSREYRRLFGLPPIQDSKKIRKLASGENNEFIVS